MSERARLNEAREQGVPWKQWGPYLSERQWGTVREDYSTTGNAWDYFPHDQARSRAYRRGEDGLAGFSDDKQLLCLGLALWNGADPILKERLFGLTNSEGNHGEDVKECYYYLDATPTNSYLKYLYKYPQRAYPYDDIVATNRQRSRTELEYELLDTGVFDEDRYFDVFVEYAKAAPDDVAMKITVANRGDERARLHVLPTLWFRNTWSWKAGSPKPSLTRADGAGATVVAEHETLGTFHLECDADVPLLFTENETNNQRIFGTPNASPYVKDGINDAIVGGNTAAVNGSSGTKAAAHYDIEVGPKSETTIHLRLSPASAGRSRDVCADVERAIAERKHEADAFYAPLESGLSADEALVMRQSLAGMLWSKQYYNFDVAEWLQENGADVITGTGGEHLRNAAWQHMVNDDVISMPDKWEYPWYAAWDLAFHAIPLAMVDVDFAKEQLMLVLKEVYLHPNGQLPAYEWAFGDVNPPVHAFAVKLIYDMDKAQSGKGDIGFLRRAFDKLLLNFTWWVNRKDRLGKNVFDGGFLGLDNIGVFDRSSPLPSGGWLEQADGTAWMVFFSASMLEIALELTRYDATFGDMGVKFAEHFLWIAVAVHRGSGSMWDEEDGFFYDVLRTPNGDAQRLKVRSLVGLLPMAAVLVLDKDMTAHVPHALERFRARLKARPDLARFVPNVGVAGVGDSRLISLVNEAQLRRVLSRMLDENEFLGEHGIRSLSRHHLEHPYVLNMDGVEYSVGYRPGDSDSMMFGGNSNWRGPVWMPINILLVRALMQYYRFFGDDFKIECPTGSGTMMTLFEVAGDLARRLARVFLRDARGRRPVFGAAEKLQNDPHFRDHILFYEYFHGDNGAGIGASHQTGWTGLIGYLLRARHDVDAQGWLVHGREQLLEARRKRSA